VPIALRAVALAAAGAVTLHATQQPPTGPVLPGTVGTLHHSIQTAAPEAQRLFDQGLTLFYGFSRDASRLSFERAAALDSRAAMPHAGIALALGPNINVDATPAEVRAACGSARKAAALARDAGERGYADALVARYCGSGIDGAAYAAALAKLSDDRPADADAAVLYADSLLALRPRTPAQQQTLVTVLESVLRTQPSHVGANHYYIHAVEGSPTPERALRAAKRLETLVTASGHLLHMPSHVYMRIGEYEASVSSNESAATTDLAYLRNNPPSHDAAMSYTHNLESLAVAAGFLGRFAQARQAAQEIARVDAGMAGVAAAFSPPLAFILLRFHDWAGVMSLPSPPATDLPGSMMSHFARAIAIDELGNAQQALSERRLFAQAVQGLPKDAVYRSNSTGDVIALFEAVIDARLASDRAAAIAAWERAVTAQDRLVYHEPPPFYYPVRESLGAALFGAGRYADAERVFRDDLARNKRNGRSLYGVWQTVAALKRGPEIARAREAFARAWASSDVKLDLTRY
jgi:tetratricopeptide (TPR) repeat protein